MTIQLLQDLIWPALLQTLAMVGASSLIAFLIGLPLALILYITRPDGLAPQKTINTVLGWVVNVLRSLPFVILLFLCFPLTRLLVGKIVGTAAAVVPISLSAAPFLARLFEGHFQAIDKGVLEAARAMGSTKTQLIFRVILPESVPAMVHAVTVTIINIVAYSAMAGLVGGGGLGDVANVYGYQMRRYQIMAVAVLLIIILVQIVQFVGNTLAKRLDHK